MAWKKKKPCETYEVSYIKVTYDKDGRVTSANRQIRQQGTEQAEINRKTERRGRKPLAD